MKVPAAVLAGVVVVVSGASSAHADPTAPELQAQGEDLAKQGRFSEAIDAFKAADKLQSSAAHACLIALAYTRRELWPQAEIWLAQCQVRATAQDPLPDWAPAEKDQIDQRLATANVAPVEIEVQPADAGAKVTVSSFAPDEQFSPRTIHLPPGIHQLIVSAPGYQDGHQLLDIKDKTPQHIVIKLEKPGQQKVVMPPPLPPPVSTAASDPGKTFIVAGAATLVAGVGTWLWMGYEHNQLEDALDIKKNPTYNDQQTAYDAHSTRYDIARVSTITLLAVGAGLTVYGFVRHSKHEEVPAVGLAPTHGGGFVSLEWSR